MTIPQSWFSNVVPIGNMFYAHVGGFVYVFDAQLRLQSTSAGSLFEAPFMQLPVRVSGEFYALGRNQRAELALFRLHDAGNEELCGVPESSFLCSAGGDLLVVAGSKYFSYECGCLLFRRAHPDIVARYVFDHNGAIFVLTGDEVVELSESLEVVRRAAFQATNVYYFGTLLYSEGQKSVFDLLTFQQVKIELKGSIWAFALYGADSTSRASRFEVFYRLCTLNLPRSELYERVNAEMETQDPFYPLLQLNTAFYAYNSAFYASMAPHIACPVPSTLAIGYLPDLRRCKNIFRHEGLFHAQIHTNLVAFGPEWVIQRVYETQAAAFCATSRCIYAITAGDVSDIHGKHIATLPGTATQPVFKITFAVRDRLFALCQAEYVAIYILNGAVFEQMQTLEDVFEVLACYVFAQALYIVGRDQALATVLYIYQFKAGAFKKADDLFLESSGNLEYFYGVLVDLQQNTLIDLDSRVVYRRQAPNIVYVRRTIYPFGIGLVESFLAEFSGFQVDLWKKKMESIFCRDVQDA